MNGKILVVDKDKTLTDELQAILASQQYDVTVVHDGETAVKKAINQSFDAIILDVMLPKINGFDVLKSIRHHKQTPVLLLTARTDEIDKIIGFEIGADDYLSKPCSSGELVARIKAILRRTKKRPLAAPL